MSPLTTHRLILQAAGPVIPPTNFGAVDWAIVAVYILGSVAIGVVANRYIGRLSDFLVAGRSIRVWLGIATMTGTEIGLVTLVYMGLEGYASGLSSLHVGLVWGAGALIIGLTGFIVYRLRREGVMTIPEFYGKRFGAPVRWFGGLILASMGILNMGLFLRAGADFISAVTGLESDAWLETIMVSLMVLVLLYTTLGGMVSIILTDLVQFVFLGLGMVVVTILLIVHLGWDPIFEAAATQRGGHGLDPLDEANGYGGTYVVSMVLMAVSAAALWQSGTLRALSAKSPRTAKRIYTFSSITFMSRFVIPAFWGVCAWAFLSLEENAALSALVGDEDGAVYRPLQAMPLMIGHVVPPVLLGGVVAAMVAAFMSTHDSYLLCWASVLTQDVVAPLVPGGVSDRGRITLTRVFVVAQGLFLLWWGLWYTGLDKMWTYMATTGAAYLSGASAVVVGGLYWRWVTPLGALSALLAGCVAVLPVFRDMPPLAGLAEEHEGFGDFLANPAAVQVTAFVSSWVAMIVVSLLSRVVFGPPRGGGGEERA